MQSLTIATIKYPAGKTFDGKYGPRANVLAVLPGGDEVKVWASPEELASYRKGDCIHLLQDGNGYKPVAIGQQPQLVNHPAPQATAPKPEIDKAAIADYATQQAKLYAFCYSQARAAMPEDAPDAAIQAAASSVYIATGRKFNL
jgi:hypothetical protein